MKIKITGHAKDRMRKYGISEDMIVETLKNPDCVLKGHHGRLIAQKALDERFLLRMVYEESGGVSTVAIKRRGPATSVEYDKELDILVIKLEEVDSLDYAEDFGDLIIHFKDDKPVEIEVLNASKLFSKLCSTQVQSSSSRQCSHLHSPRSFQHRSWRPLYQRWTYREN